MNRSSRQHQPLGTGTPLWIAAGLALVGIMGSVSASWLMMASESRLEIGLPWEGPAAAEHERRSTAPTPERPVGQTNTAGAGGGTPQTGASEAAVPAVPSDTPATATTEMAAVEVSEAPEAASRDRPSRSEHTPSKPMPFNNQAVEKEHAGQGINAASEQACPTLFTINFDRASEDIVDARIERQVEALASWLNARPKAKVVIEGHADAAGPEEYNLLLSYRRAKTVSALFLDAGVRETQVKTRAYGELMPMPGFPSESPKNRRVTVGIAGAKTCPEL
jgi:outer membrane protein OmpA-like peptidoglycan-associated protein